MQRSPKAVLLRTTKVVTQLVLIRRLEVRLPMPCLKSILRCISMSLTAICTWLIDGPRHRSMVTQISEILVLET